MPDQTAPPRPKQIRQPRTRVDPKRARIKELDELLRAQMAIHILVALDRHGLLTNAMLQDLLFRDHRDPREDARLKNPEAAMTRGADRLIRHLFNAGYILRETAFMRSANGNDYPHIYNMLSSKGAALLEDYYTHQNETTGSSLYLRWKPSANDRSPYHIPHALEINRFYVALQRAAWAADIDLTFWMDDRQLAALPKAETRFSNIPDAFFVLRAGDALLAHFLEIDRRSEVLDTLIGDTKDIKGKVAGYGRLLGEEYRDAPFFAGLSRPVVLTLTTGGPRRRDNLIKTTAKAGGAGAYWFSTAADLYPDKSAMSFWNPVWQVPEGLEARSLLQRVRLAAKS